MRPAALRHPQWTQHALIRRNAVLAAWAMASGIVLYCAMSLWPYTREAFVPPGALFRVRSGVQPCLAFCLTSYCVGALFHRGIASAEGARERMRFAAMGGATGSCVFLGIWGLIEVVVSVASGTALADSWQDMFVALIVSPFLGVSFAVLSALVVLPLSFFSVCALRIVLRKSWLDYS